MGGDGDAPGMPKTRAGDDRHSKVRWRRLHSSVEVERRRRVADIVIRVRHRWSGEGRCRRWARQASVQERRWIQKETTPRQRRRARPVLGNRPTER